MYKIKYKNLLDKFKNYITINKIKQIYKARSGCLLCKQEFFTFLSEKTNCKISDDIYYDDNNRYRSCVGICFK